MNRPTTLLSAVPVPFDAHGDLDVAGQKTLLHHLKDTGIGGVFISGTTGEFTALDMITVNSQGNAYTAESTGGRRLQAFQVGAP